MSVDLLDRTIWNALTTRQAHHALGKAGARRLDPQIGPFAALRDDCPENLAALADLVGPDESVILFQLDGCPTPPGLAVEMVAPGVQMLLEGLVAPPPIRDVIEKLSAADAAEMLALATLTQPGPFRLRTHELGEFWGVRRDGRLVAMAGERLAVEGFTEVSGVCAHPDVRGQGLAGALSHHVASRMLARGEVPFLHAWAGNANAIRLYETLGFRLRREMVVTVFRRA